MNFRLLTASLLLAGFASAQTANPFFAGDEVHEIWLTINKADWWETLDARHRANDNEMIEADLTWNATKLPRVGVRFKGNSSYGHPGRKKPFRIDFDKFVKDQKIGDISSLSLGNNWGDPSFVREDSFYRADQQGLREIAAGQQGGRQPL
jgi:spore coat protein CotH